MSIDIIAYAFNTCEKAEEINQKLREEYSILLAGDFVIYSVRALERIRYQIACEDLNIDPSIKCSFLISLNNKMQAHRINDVVTILKNAYGNDIKIFFNGEKEL